MSILKAFPDAHMDGFLDREAWQSMLEHEGLACLPGAPMAPVLAAVGLLRRADYQAQCGTLLVWESAGAGMSAAFRPYTGRAPDDLALLLIAAPAELLTLCAQGLAQLPAMIRKGRLDPFILKTMAQLEAAGLGDFIEALGLNFPVH